MYKKSGCIVFIKCINPRPVRIFSIKQTAVMKMILPQRVSKLSVVELNGKTYGLFSTSTHLASMYLYSRSIFGRDVTDETSFFSECCDFFIYRSVSENHQPQRNETFTSALHVQFWPELNVIAVLWPNNCGVNHSGREQHHPHRKHHPRANIQWPSLTSEKIKMPNKQPYVKKMNHIFGYRTQETPFLSSISSFINCLIFQK